MTSTPLRVFVAGGAGGVGRGVVTQWLAAGTTVVTVSRDARRLAGLTSATSSLAGRLVAEVGSGSDEELLRRLGEEHGPYDQVVASVGGGGWQIRSLQGTSSPMLHRIVDDGVTAHWILARALRPHLRETSSYVFVNGGAALEVLPGAGALSLVARAQVAMAAIFAAEEPRAEVRTTSLVLASPVATPEREPPALAEWLTPADVGEACRHLAAGDHRGVVVVRTRRDVAALARPDSASRRRQRARSAAVVTGAVGPRAWTRPP